MFQLLLLLEREFRGFHSLYLHCFGLSQLLRLVGQAFSLSLFQFAPLAIVGVVAWIVLKFAIALHHKQMIDHLVHKISVVAHHYHATSEVGEILLKHIECHDVEVVGRFIENQEVGRTHQHCAEIEAALLSSRQLIHIIILFLGRKEEVLEELRDTHLRAIAHLDIFGNVAHHIDHLLLVVERHAILRVIAEAHSLADVEMPLVGSNLSEEHLQESRFTSAVVAYDAHLLVAREGIVVVFQDDLVGLSWRMALEALIYILGSENL